MWKKILVIIISFYFLLLLQNSFFTHLSLFGATPNLVFILFFLLVFFSAQSKPVRGWEIFFYAVFGGLFLDLFSYTYIGLSITAFIIIGFLVKKIQSLLQSREDKYPFIYFLPLFAISLLVYDLLMGLFQYFLTPDKIVIAFNAGIIFALIYNIIVASAFFYIYKKILVSVRHGKNI